MAIGKETGIAIGKETGIAIGKETGIAIGKEEDAKAMLAEGMSVALIAKITGLGKGEIEDLR
jgi:hypothetical protein